MPQKDFYNNIGTWRTSRDVRHMSVAQIKAGMEDAPWQPAVTDL
jgi:hypothetical protein